MDLIQEMYAFKYKIALGYIAKDMDGNVAEIGKAVEEILHLIPCSRSRRMEVVNLFVKTKRSGLDIAGTYQYVIGLITTFVKDKFSTITFDDELKGLEEYFESWDKYLTSSENLDTLFSMWHNGEIRKEKILNNNWYETCNYFKPKETICKIMMNIWEVKMNDMKRAMIGSVFKFLRKKEADMERTAMFIKMLFDSIANLEAKLGYCERQLFKGLVKEPYILILKDYYHEESCKSISMISTREYIKKCVGILDYEVEIAKRFLPETVETVVDTLRDNLINCHFAVQEPLLEFESFAEFHKPDDLKKIYNLVKQSPEVMNCLKKELQFHEEVNFCNLRKTCDASKFCETFITKYREETNYIANVFDSANEILSALDKGISKAINMTLNAEKSTKPDADVNVLPIPDILANYCDNFMRTGTNGLNKVELEKKFDDIITLFRFIDDKDIFGKLYSKSLSERLILSSSQSVEADEMLINKLKSNCGYLFVKNLKKMVTDNVLSKELTSKFNVEVGLTLSFNVLIMQSGLWPIKASISSLLVPQELANASQYFNEFYSKTFNGRKLYWHHALSTCDIKLNYLSKSYTIQASVVVTAILAIFNNVEAATFEEIRIVTNIDAKDLLKYLQFLSTYGILLSNDEIGKSKFSLNHQYENKREKFKLMPIIEEATQEAKVTTKSVVEDRKLYLQALVVRIMKAKKTMTHKELLNDVMNQIIANFVPNHYFIERIVEDLIVREYLERAKGQSNTYNYLA